MPTPAAIRPYPPEPRGFGPFTDEEAPKKSLTDALSKAMSWLGFAADIHLGRWDDNKYVNAAARAYEGERAAPVAPCATASMPQGFLKRT